MARKIIDTGVVGNDGTGDSIRDSFRKVNDNFRELYSSLGLGEKLTFKNLDDTPNSYLGQENAILSVNNTETGIVYKQITPGAGISLDFTTNQNEIRISSEFSEVVGDTSPQLGGNLSARSGSTQFRIKDLGTDGIPLVPVFDHEAINKRYADGKVSRAGTAAIDPRTGLVNGAFGTMSGPLILARDPEPDDDDVYDGLIAATKRYVDNSAFGSTINLYVATSGVDDRPGVSAALQGRALAYAYRTLEAALKRAEEIVLEARNEIGPYKKTLTYNNGVSNCTLTKIEDAPGSGSGFSGSALMSVDTMVVNSVGVNYQIGDILTVVGGTFSEPARLQILSTTEAGGVLTFRIVSSGVYTILPLTSTNVATTDDSDNGQLATVNLTYKVNNVVVNSGGSGFGLASVRISGGGGAGAFGTADVVGGSVISITVTDQGSGFTSQPVVTVSLPRFFIETGGYRTDFTGDYSTSTPSAIRSRDIREGLFLRGETSGALAQILGHTGSLDSSGDEIFDVDLRFGKFLEPGDIGYPEVISYGDVQKNVQLSVLVESGVYEENLPLRVPANVSIVGDEFRRCIIRPKPGISSSPWAFLYFRRDLTVGVVGTDQITLTDRLFGYHYLQGTDEPVYPLINNRGFYRAAAQLLTLNRTFIQKEVIAWITDQVDNETSPFTASFLYDSDLCERDIGLLLDAMIFDLKYGGANRTISAALKYFGSASGLIAIGAQGDETLAAISRVGTLAQLVVRNVTIQELFQDVYPQIVDGAYVAETGTTGTSFNITGVTNGNPIAITTGTAHGLVDGDQILISTVGGATQINGNDYYVDVINPTSFYIYSDALLTIPVNGAAFGTYTSGGNAVSIGGVLGALFDAVIDILDGVGSSNINLPKNNNEMDVLLCNDATRTQAITFQGHGGFAMVLDPEGQILAKSPYAQECASFSRSTGRQTFAGGQYIDGFTGNLKFKLLSKDSDTFLRVGNLARLPQLPGSFIVDDTIYRINYVRDYTFNVAGSTASFVMDETTPWPFALFNYNEAICRRDVGLILDGVGYDVVFSTNYHARRSGLTYRLASAAVVINDQLDLTVRAIEQAHDDASTYLELYPTAQAVVASSKTIIANIVREGSIFAPSLSFTLPPSLAANRANAKSLLQANITYIVDQAVGYLATTYPALTFNDFARDIEYAIESLIYDIIYGGNSETRKIGLKYWDGVGDAVVLQIPVLIQAATAAGIDHAKYVAKQVILDLAPAVSYSATTRISGAVSDAAIQAVIETLFTNVSAILTGGVGSAAAETLPDLTAYAYLAAGVSARSTIVANKTLVQDSVIAFIDENANVYEVLMPGNRSMLSNDFTQINDLGYGIVVNNGGLAECVSMFTYYCHISYYSIGGGQIRSIGGSSAHGNFALVAEGSDPLEVPTPVTLYYDLAQGAECYFPSGLYANTVGGLQLFVTNYTHPPLANGELEVDHGLGDIYRYPITGVSTDDSLPAGVSRLSLRSSEGVGVDGIAAVIPNGTPLTIRQNSNVVLTGNAVDVAVRPSTGLVLAESPEVYRVLQFEAYADFVGARTFTVSLGTPAIITRAAHGLQPGYQITLTTTGALPTGLVAGETYFVQADGFTVNTFRLSSTKRGTAINTSGSQSGTHTYIVFGLAQTTLRENYNYVDLSLFPQQPFVTSAATCTITIANPAVVTLVSHGFVADDVVKFTTTGALPGGILATRLYFVKTVIGANSFTITDVATSISVALETTGTQSGVQRVGKVIGRAGDSTVAVVPISSADEGRLLGTKLVFKGVEYTVQAYQNELITGENYGLLTLNTPLVDSVIYFTNLPTLKAAVPKDESGTLTIRISLTRVTSHDLLEIGTGSYADTNYPNEIFGPPVNALDPDSETQERDVGRVFYVTTDQFGNFSVGPYFRVDQGTGTVTFAASIALSNLDGLGFKRGVPVSEFSTDNAFADNATDTVPTENATRGYIDRRLGISHTGAAVVVGSVIPAFSGGFMALDGQLAMKADMDLGSFKIFNLANPVNPTDAVNLQTLTLNNLSDVAVTASKSADILTFTGAGDFAQNSTMVGDISLSIDSTANTVDAQINPNVIVNADINSAAGIVQSKLVLSSATTRVDATSITQAEKGISSFDSAQFDVTDGWVTLKDNGINLTDLPQIATKTVLGNSTLATANVAAVLFSTVVSDGGAIKKSQYNTSTGYLRRIGFTTTNDGDYAVIDEATAATASTLVKRDGNADFAGRFISMEKLIIDTKTILDTTATATGGYTQLYGFANNVGILIGDGSVATDKRTFYDNDSHVFRTYNGLSNAPITVGSITTPVITTGAAATAGTITGNWTLTAGSKLQSTYSADLAEYYQGDREYAVGTVLIFGGDKEVTVSQNYGDHRVAGVVSDTAGYTMNGACPGHKNLIALQGRVPCRVVGKIKKGDLIVTSNIPGVGISATGDVKAGTIIGKSLVDYDSDHIGTVEVAVGRT